jgi:hypothetical protein
MKINATKIMGKDLKPGDLFSTVGQIYWDVSDNDKLRIGEKVYIRTNSPCPKDQLEEPIYKITIQV